MSTTNIKVTGCFHLFLFLTTKTWEKKEICNVREGDYFVILLATTGSSNPVGYYPCEHF